MAQEVRFTWVAAIHALNTGESLLPRHDSSAA